MARQPQPQDGGAWPYCDRCGKQIVPDGLGTALKPAYEPIYLARKPFERTVAENVLAHGTGALNIDACRIGVEGGTRDVGSCGHSNGIYGDGLPGHNFEQVAGLGRWPANLVHDGSEEALAAFPVARASGHTRESKSAEGCHTAFFGGAESHAIPGVNTYVDSGSAARFFYCGKAGPEDRLGSRHPTVKPLALMRWLVRLVTPPGGLVLDPFAGTGTTAHAALLEGFRCALIEREAEYAADIERRMALVFAGSVERTSAEEPETTDALPLFGGADVAGGGTTFGERITARKRRRTRRTIGPIGMKW